MDRVEHRLDIMGRESVVAIFETICVQHGNRGKRGDGMSCKTSNATTGVPGGAAQCVDVAAKIRTTVATRIVPKKVPAL
jgi:hypothetical protein